MLPHHGGFTALVIVNDKANDSTINEILPLIHVKVIQIDYNHAESELTEESKQDILSKTCDDNFYNELPHAFIFLDDAINILFSKEV
jgi:hypothetical protein